MPDLIDGSENVTVHGIFNWILLLIIFSIITAVGNYLGYKQKIFGELHLGNSLRMLYIRLRSLSHTPV